MANSKSEDALLQSRCFLHPFNGHGAGMAAFGILADYQGRTYQIERANPDWDVCVIREHYGCKGKLVSLKSLQNLHVSLLRYNDDRVRCKWKDEQRALKFISVIHENN